MAVLMVIWWLSAIIEILAEQREKERERKKEKDTLLQPGTHNNHWTDATHGIGLHLGP